MEIALGILMRGPFDAFAGEIAADAFGPDFAKLEYLLNGGHEIVHVRGRLFEVEEIVVDNRIRLGLQGEVAAGGLLPEEYAPKQITVTLESETGFGPSNHVTPRSSEIAPV